MLQYQMASCVMKPVLGVLSRALAEDVHLTSVLEEE